MTKHELGKHIENILDKGDKISIFERNILAISTYSATLAKELLEIKENKNFNVYMGADPLALNIINTKNYEYLYKNPLDDVTKQINEFEKICSLFGSFYLRTWQWSADKIALSK